MSFFFQKIRKVISYEISGGICSSRGVFALFLFCLTAAFYPMNGESTHFTIPASDVDSLISAVEISIANPGAGPHTIYLTESAYEFTDPCSVGSFNALPAISNNTILTIDGNGALLERDSDNFFRLFQIDGGSVLKVKNMTLQNGRVSTSGGAIYNKGNTSLIGVDLLGNKADAHGGAIYNEDSGVYAFEMTLDNCRVEGDSANAGGGIYNQTNSIVSTIEITNSRICHNTASSSASSHGGAIYNKNNVMMIVTLVNTAVDSNNAIQGGGIYNSSSGSPGSNLQVSIEDCDIIGNVADMGEGGAGIYNEGPATGSIIMELVGTDIHDNVNDGVKIMWGIVKFERCAIKNNVGSGIINQDSLYVVSCEISGNHAAYSDTSDGGGILNYDRAGIYNSTISGNSATRSGGGIYNGDMAILFLEHSTVVNNTSDSDQNTTGNGGGVYNMSGGAVHPTHTIIAENIIDSGSSKDVYGNFSSTGYNLIGDTGGSFGFGVTDITDQPNPQLGPLQDNGGPTLTHALLTGSPGIDAGDPAYVQPSSPDPLYNDQRGAGYRRVKDGNIDGSETIDIGAYELNPTHFSIIATALPRLDYSDISWGDYDNDGDLDILMNGQTVSLNSFTTLYNNISGTFAENMTATDSLVDLSHGSVDWGDYDNDGDLDILLTGTTNGTPAGATSRIYQNDNGAFRDIYANLTGLTDSDGRWGDYDNDGDLDLLIMGRNSVSGYNTLLYRNGENDSFHEISGATIEELAYGSIDWGNFDNDGDLDILLTGTTNGTSAGAASYIYQNDGGSFTDLLNTGIENVYGGEAIWGDYDNDGDLDILLTGRDQSGSDVTKIYQHNETGDLFDDIIANLPVMSSGSAAWGDYGNDGDLDIVINGVHLTDTLAVVCFNDGNDGAGFSDRDTLDGTTSGAVRCADYDNDGKLDLLFVGQNSGEGAYLYRNTANMAPNAPPDLPASPNLTSIIETDGRSVTLSWASFGDALTPDNGLCYNIWVGSQIDRSDIISPMAVDTVEASNFGFRRIVDRGGADHSLDQNIRDISPGKYYWSVQAIDTGYMGSEFAPVDSFSLCPSGNVVYVDDVHPEIRDGSGFSWDHATSDLQEGLVIAEVCENVDQIWVAAGAYYPSTNGNRDVSFHLLNGVSLYGGFSGNETSLDQRDYENQETVLSGNIGAPEDSSDNCYHVVVGSGTDPSAVLDGFSIIGGYADQAPVTDSGGGVFNNNGSPTIRHCRFRENFAHFGGAIANIEGSRPTIWDCSFGDNEAQAQGGAIFNEESDPVIFRCEFTNNICVGKGGAIFNKEIGPLSKVEITHCLFFSNKADSGGAIFHEDANSLISQCVFVGNVAQAGDGGAIVNQGSSTISGCTLSGNQALNGHGGGIFVLSDTTRVNNSILWHNEDTSGMDSSAQLAVSTGSNGLVAVSSSILQGGWTGAIANNPGFRRLPDPGPDNAWGTNDDNPGDLTLSACSPAIDAGDASLIPLDDLDMDQDGNTTEPVPMDQDGNTREVDGDFDNSIQVDIGAYELPEPHDYDNDAIANECDQCPGFNDFEDSDDDGVSDSCDAQGARHALYFDGIDDAVGLGNPGGLNFNGEITLEAWIYPEASDNIRNIIAHNPDMVAASYGGTFLRVNNGAYEVGSFDGTSYYSATFPIPAGDIGSWVHVAGAYDGTNWNLYRNGIEISETPSSIGAVTTDSSWTIGHGSYSGIGDYFKGFIDEIRIWRYARSREQIRENMCRQLSMNGSVLDSLLAYYRCDHPTGTPSLIDLTSHGFTGELADHNTGNGDANTGPQWLGSGAPIGDQSKFEYNIIPLTTEISLFASPGITVDNITNPEPDAIHLYRIDGQADNLAPPTGFVRLDSLRYYGLFLVDGDSSTYRLRYGYTAHPDSAEEADFGLAYRESYADIDWEGLDATLDTTANTLTTNSSRSAPLIISEANTQTRSSRDSRNGGEYIIGIRDRSDFVVTNTNNSGIGSLREAMENANTNADLDTIIFNIPGNSIHVISPTENLPLITNPVVINGFTQPGSHGDDFPLTLRIVLNGNHAALSIQADSCVIQGVVVQNDSTNAGVSIIGSNNRITGCYIGVDSTGTQSDYGNRFGVTVQGNHNWIGTADATNSQGNIIGNSLGGPGVKIISGSLNRIVYNRIGVGTVFQNLGNSAGGIVIDSTATRTEIIDNFILWNDEVGVSVSGDSTHISENIIGDDDDAGSSLPNYGHGILIDGGSDASEIMDNIISYNRGHGIRIANGLNNQGHDIQANFIVGNDSLGISLSPLSNGNIVAPILTSVLADGIVEGTLDGASPGFYRLEFFSNSSCDPSGSGEGELFLTRELIVLNGGALGDFTVDLGQNFTPGTVITATVTDTTMRNTSEFSNCETVAQPIFQVVSHNPEPGAENVPLNQQIMVRFSDAVNITALTDSAFQVRGSLSDAHTGTFTGAADSVLFTLTSSFMSGELVTVILTSLVTATTGVDLNPPYSWQFRTIADSGHANFIPAYRSLLENRTTSVVMGDVDNDGDMDVISGNLGQPNRFYLNNGTEYPFQNVGGLEVSDSETDSTLCLALADIDNDGDLDLVVGNKDQPNRIYLNNLGSNPYSSSIDINPQADETRTIAVCDIDNDGYPDIITGNYHQPNRIYRNIGGNSFSIEVLSSANDATTSLALGDVDNDGDFDIFVGNYAESNRLYINDGTGNYTLFSVSRESRATFFPIDTDTTTSLAIGDIDNDGDIDLVSGNHGVNYLYLNHNGDFSDVRSITSDADPTLSVALADLDGDGYLDIVTAIADSSKDRFYMNDGGTPPSWIGHDVSCHEMDSYGVAVGDVDGDLDMDIVVGAMGHNHLYLNGSREEGLSVTLTDDRGFGSLRNAMKYANCVAGNDEIRFNIAPPDTHTIRPKTPLPRITETLTIDGTSQPISNRSRAGRADNPPGITLDGSLAPSSSLGLDIGANQSIVRGLKIINFQVGIKISSAHDVTIDSNAIFDNDGLGIKIDYSDLGNLIHQNRIAYNGSHGIEISSAHGVTIDSNAIFDNDGLGIKIDSGANHGMEPPTITSMYNGSLILSGYLSNVDQNATYRLQFFRNAICDISGFGEGETLIADTLLTASVVEQDSSFTFDVEFPGDFAIQPHEFITATVTDTSTGSSSEFSNCIELAGSIQGYAWTDQNYDGIQDAAESGFDNLLLELYEVVNSQDQFVDSTRTDSSGDYLFEGLPEGDYKIQVPPMFGYLFTQQYAGIDTTLDSDVNPATAWIPTFHLSGDEQDTTRDIGLYLDEFPPTSSIVQPIQDCPDSATTVYISASDSNGVGVSRIDLYEGTVSDTLLVGTTMFYPAQAFIDNNEMDYTPRQEGDLFLYTIATDSLGNRESIPVGQAPIAFFSDQTAPTAIAPDAVAQNDTIRAIAIVSDNLGLSSIVWYVNNSSLPEKPLTGTSAIDTLVYIETQSVVNAVSYAVDDSCGNVAYSDTSSVIIDLHAPQTEIAAPNDTCLTDSDFSVSVEMTDGSAISSLDSLIIYGKITAGTWSQLAVFVNIGGVRDDFQIILPYEGIWTLASVGVDESGNREPLPQSGDVVVTYDQTPPTANALSAIAQNDTIRAIATVSDNLELSSIVWYVNNSSLPEKPLTGTSAIDTLVYIETQSVVNAVSYAVDDSCGNVAYSDTASVTIDLQAPQTEIAAPNDTCLTDSDFSVSVEMTDGSAISSLDSLIIYGKITAGTWSQLAVFVNIGGVRDDFQIILPYEGIWTLASVGVDESGNREPLPQSGDVVVTYDQTPPTANALSAIAQNDTIRAIATVSDNLGLSSIIWYVNDSSLSARALTGISAIDTLVYTAIQSGVYAVSYWVYDSCGNVTYSDTASVTIDLHAPQSSIIAPGDTCIQTSNLLLTVTSEDGLISSGIDSLIVYGNDGTGWRTLAINLAPFSTRLDAEFSFSLPYPGIWQLASVSVDSAGNSEISDLSDLTRDVVVTYDPIPPQVGLDPPLSYYVVSDVILSYSALDSIRSNYPSGSGVAGQVERLRFFSQQGAGSFDMIREILSPIPSDTMRYTPSTDGLYRFYIQGEDCAGNIGSSDVITLFVDREPPTATLESIPNCPDTPISIVIGASDEPNASGVASIEIWRLDSGSWQQLTILSPTANTFTPSINTGGFYQYAAVAVDSAGNRETDDPEQSALSVEPEVAFVIDFSAPVGVSLSGQEGYHTTDFSLSYQATDLSFSSGMEAILYWGSFSDNSRAAEDSILLHSLDPTHGETGGGTLSYSGLITMNMDHIENGDWAIWLMARDGCGNSLSSSPLHIIIDSQIPQLVSFRLPTGCDSVGFYPAQGQSIPGGTYTIQASINELNDGYTSGGSITLGYRYEQDPITVWLTIPTYWLSGFAAPNSFDFPFDVDQEGQGDGEYTFYFSISDSAGNSVEINPEIAPWTVDRQPPSADLDPLSPTSATPNLTLTYEFGDNETWDVVQLWISGDSHLWRQVDSQNSPTGQFDYQVNGNGDYCFLAIAWDACRHTDAPPEFVERGLTHSAAVQTINFGSGTFGPSDNSGVHCTQVATQLPGSVVAHDQETVILCEADSVESCSGQIGLTLPFFAESGFHNQLKEIELWTKSRNDCGDFEDWGLESTINRSNLTSLPADPIHFPEADSMWVGELTLCLSPDLYLIASVGVDSVGLREPLPVGNTGDMLIIIDNDQSLPFGSALISSYYHSQNQANVTISYSDANGDCRGGGVDSIAVFVRRDSDMDGLFDSSGLWRTFTDQTHPEIFGSISTIENALNLTTQLQGSFQTQYPLQQGLSDGIYQFYAIAADRSSCRHIELDDFENSLIDPTAEIIVDHAPPTVEIPISDIEECYGASFFDQGGDTISITVFADDRNSSGYPLSGIGRIGLLVIRPGQIDPDTVGVDTNPQEMNPGLYQTNFDLVFSDLLQPIEDGNYQLIPFAFDRAGNRNQESEQRIFQIDSTPPEFQAGPVIDSYYQQSSSIQIRYQASDDIRLERVYLSYRQDTSQPFIDTGLSLTGHLGAFSFGATQDGLYQFRLRAVDSCGNQTLSGIDSAFVDRVIPETELSLETRDSGCQSAPVFLLSYEIDDGESSSGIDSLIIWGNRGEGDWTILAERSNPEMSDTVSISIPEQGIWRVTGQSFDLAGNREAIASNPNLILVFDLDPPEILIETLSPYISGNIVTLEFEATDPVGIDQTQAVSRVDIYYDDGLGADFVPPLDGVLIASLTEELTQRASYEVHIDELPGIHTHDGLYYFRAVAFDCADNSAPSDPVSTLVDRIAPQAEIIDLPDCPSAQQLTLTYPGDSDLSGIVSVEIWIDLGAEGADWNFIQTLPGSPVSYPLPILGDGQYRYAAIAIDAAGNRETTPPLAAEADFVVDNLSPTFPSPMVTPDYSTDPILTVPYRAGDIGGIQYVELFYRLGPYDDPNSGFSSYEIQLEPIGEFLFDSDSLQGDGTYYFQQKAVDLCGNSAYSNIDYTVIDTHAPTVYLTLSDHPFDLCASPSDPTREVVLDYQIENNAIPGENSVSGLSRLELQTANSGEWNLLIAMDSPSLSGSLTIDLSHAPYPELEIAAFRALAGDSAGNISPYSDILEIEIQDRVPPSLVCPEAITLYADDGCSASLPDITGQAIVEDNCDPAPSILQDPAAGSTLILGDEMTVYLTATDLTGNFQTCPVQINVRDTIAPILTVPPDTALSCDHAYPDPEIFGYGTAIDNCDPEPVISYTDSLSGDLEECPLTVTRYWTTIDESGNESQAIQRVFLAENNQPPWVEDDQIETNEDIPVEISVLDNDVDPDGNMNPSTLTIVDQPGKGSVEIIDDNARSIAVYTPNLNFFGNDNFSYSVSDSLGEVSALAIVDVIIHPINDVPVAVDDQTETLEDVPISIPVSDNDEDIDGALILSSITVVTPPVNGSVELIEALGRLVYTPDPNFFGLDTLIYRITDDSSAVSNPARVGITIYSLNDPPTARDDTTETMEDMPIQISVLDNDADIDGELNPASIVIVNPPMNGEATIVQGEISYDPDENFFGQDSLTYTVSDDSSAASNPARVRISIDDVNDPPTARDDAVETPEDTPIQIPVLDNDFDIDGELNPASIVIVNPPVNGEATIVQGEIIYDPDENFFGRDSLTYTVADNDTEASNPALVRVSIGDANDSPTARDDAVETPEDTPIQIPILDNDFDIDGELDPTSIVIVNPPMNGEATIIQGEISYDPDENFFGRDSLTYTVADNDTEASNLAYVRILTLDVNDPPIAQGDTAETIEDTPIQISVLDNDFDIDGELNPASIVIVNPPVNGEATIIQGEISYDPDENFFGRDSLTYTVADNDTEASNPAYVRILTIGVNDPPIAQDDTTETMEDTAIQILVLTNDSDIDGELNPASIVIVNPPVSGEAIIVEGGINYRPDENFFGRDSLTYTVADDDTDISNLAYVRILTVSVNDPPFAGDDEIITPEDNPVQIDILENDDDVDGELDSESIVIVNQPVNGQATIAQGEISYDPDENFFGQDSLTYTVADNDGVSSNSATVRVTTTPLNDPPSPPTPYMPATDTVLTSDSTALEVENGDDIEGDPLTYTFQVSEDPDFQTAHTNVSGLLEGENGVTQYTVTGLFDNRIFYWRSRTFDGADSSGWSDVRRFSVSLSPETVSEVTVSDHPEDQGRALDVIWPHAEDDLTGADDVAWYRVYRIFDQIPVLIDSIPATDSTGYAYIDSSLIVNQTGTYQMVVVDESGNASPFSQTGSATAIDNVPPEPVQDMIAEDAESDQGGRIALRWGLSPDDPFVATEIENSSGVSFQENDSEREVREGAGDVVAYHLYRGENQDVLYSLTTLPAGLDHYLDDAVQDSVFYFYHIIVDDGNNRSEPEDPISATPSDNLAPTTAVSDIGDLVRSAAVRFTVSGWDTIGGETGSPAEELSYLYRLTALDQGAGQGSWQPSLVPTIDLYPLQDGAYHFAAAAVDLAGNADTTAARNYAEHEFAVWTSGVSLPDSLWQLIGFPREPDDPSVQAVLGDDVALPADFFYWDPSATQDPFMDQYFEVSSIETQQGYWLWLPESDTIDVSGDFLLGADGLERPLYIGWNQISSGYAWPINWGDARIRNGDQEVSVAQADAENWIQNRIYWLEDTGYNYGPIDFINPAPAMNLWAGYWLLSHTECQLLIPSDPLLENEPPAAEPLSTDAWYIRLAVSNGDRSDRSMLIGAHPVANSDYDRYDTPQPPQLESRLSLYTVHPDWIEGVSRYSADIVGLDDREWRWRLILHSDQGEVRLSGENLDSVPEGYEVRLLQVDGSPNFEDYEAEGGCVLREGEETILHFEQETAFDLLVLPINSENEIVTVSSLDQNYPNPFNPETSIAYRVGLSQNLEKLRVSLKIYNVVGQLARTLVDEPQESGSYTVQWDGRNDQRRRAVSGVYFYELSVTGDPAQPDFKQTRKMVLMR